MSKEGEYRDDVEGPRACRGRLNRVGEGMRGELELESEGRAKCASKVRGCVSTDG